MKCFLVDLREHIKLASPIRDHSALLVLFIRTSELVPSLAMKLLLIVASLLLLLNMASVSEACNGDCWDLWGRVRRAEEVMSASKRERKDVGRPVEKKRKPTMRR